MPDNLYQRPGSRFWWLRVQIGGTEHRRSLRTPDRAQAEARAAEIIAALEDEHAARVAPVAAPAPAFITWEAAVERWAEIHLTDLRPSTQERYRDTLRVLHPHMAGRPLGDAVARRSVADFVAARKRAGRTNATIKRDLDVIAMIVAAAIDAGMLPEEAPNAAAAWRRKLPERREPVAPVPLRVLARILRLAGDCGLAGLIRFLARTGCRQEEAAGLRWQDVDLRRAEATLTRTKTRRARVLRLTPATIRDLRRLPRAKGSPWVFQTATGGRWDRMPRRWRDLAARAVPPDQEPPRCHDLRHTYAIRWLQGGGDIYALSRHLGHSSVTTTERFYLAWLRHR